MRLKGIVVVVYAVAITPFNRPSVVARPLCWLIGRYHYAPHGINEDDKYLVTEFVECQRCGKDRGDSE